MAIGPKDLPLTQIELDEVAVQEVKIDEQLKRLYQAPNRVIKVATDSLSPRIANELIRRYQNAGWKRVNHGVHNMELIFSAVSE